MRALLMSTPGAMMSGRRLGASVGSAGIPATSLPVPLSTPRELKSAGVPKPCFSPAATEIVHGDVQEVREMQTVIALVRAGVGISLVPESVRALTRAGVVYRELAAGGPTVELAMAWRAGDRSPVLAAFHLHQLELGSRAADRLAHAPRSAGLKAAVSRHPAFIGFYVGNQDSRFLADNLAFDRALRSEGIKHLFRVYSGGHSSSLWQAEAAPWLGYALSALALLR